MLEEKIYGVVFKFGLKTINLKLSLTVVISRLLTLKLFFEVFFEIEFALLPRL